jgi:lipopolysaccharide transport system permease protein
MEASEAPAPARVTVVEPPRGWSFPSVREIVEHRDLIYYLARRDVVVRYKQASVGALWVLIQPLLLAGVFSLFLGRYGGLQGEPGIPYPLYALTGIVMWLFFAECLGRISQSTVSSEPLISKIYFPRAVIPIAAVIAPVVDFSLTLLVVILVTLAYGITPGVAILAAPLFVALAIAAALGAGLWLSALNVKYRDVTLIVPFLLLVGLFLTPNFYSFDIVPGSLQPVIYALNPMVGVVEGFRWALLGTDFPGPLLAIPVAMSAILIVTGALYYERAQKSFADVI